jgi:hypothetical protein
MAARYDLRIDQGATYQMSLTCLDTSGSPLDLTGYTGAAMVRGQYADASPAAIFTVTIGGADGVVGLVLTAAQTTALAITDGVWDCKLTDPSGNVTRVCEGKVTVSPEATQ